MTDAGLRICAWIAGVFVLSGAGLVAQGQKGSVSGTVVDSRSGDPVEGATVRLVCRLLDGRQFQASAESDREGRFRLSPVPACALSVAAQKQGHITSFWGQREPGLGLPRALALAEGEQRTGVTLVIALGAVITGHVMSPGGTPMTGARVEAIRLTTDSHPAPLPEAPVHDVSDDRGMFRIFGLPAGEYVVRVSAIQPTVERVPQASTADCAQLPLAKDPPVYFPGSPTLSAATRLTLGPSQEYSLGSFRAPRFESQVLSGRATGLARVHRGAALLVDGDTCVASTSLLPSGSFAFGPVPRGMYRLEVRAIDAPVIPPNAASEYNVVRSGAVLWASSHVVLGETPVVINVDLQTGYRIRGRASSEPAGYKWDPTVRDGGAPVVTLTQQLAVGAPTFEMTAPVRADGSFEFASVPPGRYMVRSNSAPTYGFLASALMGGRDALDFGFQLSSNLEDFAVVYARTTTAIRGQMTMPAVPGRQPCYAVVYPRDRALWDSHARRIAATRPDETGSFNVRNLPAGEYFVAAFDGPEPENWRSTLDFLTPAASILLVRGTPTTASLSCR